MKNYIISICLLLCSVFLLTMCQNIDDETKEKGPSRGKIISENKLNIEKEDAVIITIQFYEKDDPIKDKTIEIKRNECDIPNWFNKGKLNIATEGDWIHFKIEDEDSTIIKIKKLEKAND